MASSLLELSARATGPRSHREQQTSSWWSRLMERRRPLIDWKQLCAEPSTERQSNLPLLPCSLTQSQPLFFRAGKKYLFICSSTSFSHPWPLLACDSVSFKTRYLSASQRKLTLQNTAWPHLLIIHQTSESGVHLSKLGVYCWFMEHVLASAWQPRGAANWSEVALAVWERTCSGQLDDWLPSAVLEAEGWRINSVEAWGFLKGVKVLIAIPKCSFSLHWVLKALVWCIFHLLQTANNKVPSAVLARSQNLINICWVNK